MTPTDVHNKLVRQWILEVAKSTNDTAELMVVLESTITGALEVLNLRDKLPPSTCSVYVEEAIDNALRRFSERRK